MFADTFTKAGEYTLPQIYWVLEPFILLQVKITFQYFLEGSVYVTIILTPFVAANLKPVFHWAEFLRAERNFSLSCDFSDGTRKDK